MKRCSTNEFFIIKALLCCRRMTFIFHLKILMYSRPGGHEKDIKLMVEMNERRKLYIA